MINWKSFVTTVAAGVVAGFIIQKMNKKGGE
jgi:hypothetical protein